MHVSTCLLRSIDVLVVVKSCDVPSVSPLTALLQNIQYLQTLQFPDSSFQYASFISVALSSTLQCLFSTLCELVMLESVAIPTALQGSV